MDAQLRAAHLDVLCSADLGSEVMSRKHQVPLYTVIPVFAIVQVEIVDLVLKLRDRIAAGDVDVVRRQKLQAQLALVMQSVEEELKTVLFSNGGLRDTVP